MFKIFKLTSILAVTSSVIIGIVFIVDLVMAGYETKFLLINLFFIAIASLLVWFWITLNQKISTVYGLNQEQHIGLKYWPSIFSCLILLAIVYTIVSIICCYALIDRLIGGTALLG
ncbi:hypothetical protein [Flavobacterium sp. ENC]|uniref:hypothetical protein n=1 Tax=Flavobacterium sp. ENC TaxID=2897330 RepID=UPI001E48F356|nr:hypothetical protein [Flavobacterium sp. ENC]MCD0467711.1 hypothetical protein [Flavobacterium sp. ENC]